MKREYDAQKDFEIYKRFKIELEKDQDTLERIDKHVYKVMELNESLNKSLKKIDLLSLGNILKNIFYQSWLLDPEDYHKLDCIDWSYFAQNRVIHYLITYDKV